MTILTDQSRNDLLTDFGKSTLSDRYLLPGEDYQDLFARVATAYGDDADHTQRIYDYMSRHWFLPATPILMNGGANRGLPISCFVNSVQDSMRDILDTWRENGFLASSGGGIGTYWGHIRSIGEKVGINGKTSGVIPFIKVQDSMTLGISQGLLRRGSAAAYLPVWHPEIDEFIDVRRPTGGDPNRRSLNIHHGVVIDDAFMNAVESGAEYELKSPNTGEVIKKVKARDIWVKILTARLETGEPYIINIDTVNRRLPASYRKLNLTTETSQLCSEIHLHTGPDHLGNERTAVCCLSSLNLETWDQWHDNNQFIADVMRFLDNVLQDFIDRAPDDMAHAKYAAMRERSVGLGVMGFHSFLQDRGIAFEGVMAKVWNKRIFQHIRKQADAASLVLGEERGSNPDAADAKLNHPERFTHKMAIAPTASISIIAGNTSPGIEPISANVFLQKTLSGSFTVKNRALKKVLAKHGRDDDKTWQSITLNKGSVQHLDFLTQDERDVFKTAFELDQRWIIEHAADRQEFVDQGQSVNVFLPANIHKKDLHEIHRMAWRKGLKGLYYCRSLSIQRAEAIGVAADNVKPKYEPDECLSCQ